MKLSNAAAAIATAAFVGIAPTSIDAYDSRNIDTLERAQLAAKTLIERLDPTATGFISGEELDLQSGKRLAAQAVDNIAGCIDKKLVRCTLQRELPMALDGYAVPNFDLKDALTVGFCEAAAVKAGSGAKTAQPLNGEREDVRTRDTNLGQLIASSFLRAANQMENLTQLDIGFANAGGIRSSIDGPDVTQCDINEAAPYNNKVVVVEVDANQLVAAMENSVCKFPAISGDGEGTGRFAQMVGVEMEFDPSEAGVCDQASVSAGSRVRNLKVKRGIGYAVVVEDGVISTGEKYVIATSFYLAVLGGDGYTSLAAGEQLGESGVTEQQAVWTYIKDELNSYVDINDPPDSQSIECVGGGDCKL
eukprot:scaffold17294_cov78-Skeletonema_dohrnii-CCMP3373.AAC.1